MHRYISDIMLKLDSSLLKLDSNETLEGLLTKQKDKLKEILIDIQQRSSDKDDWLGWLKLHEEKEAFANIQKYADGVISSGKYENLVVLGIGGSALGPQCLIQALKGPVWNELDSKKRNGGLKTYFIDNVDPDWTNEILNHLDISKTLFCVITKSGGTAETVSAFLWVIAALKKKLGEKWKENLVAITDPAKGKLRAYVDKEQLTNFSVEPNVGGRFSVFSPVGMLPLALTGVKVEKFREGLEKAYEDLVNGSSATESLASKLAVTLVYCEQNGKRINPLMPYSSKLSRISDWYVQLVAESLGKTPEIGPCPIKAVGATDQHSQLQLFAEGPLDKIVYFIKVNSFSTDFPIPSEPVEGFENLAGESMKRLIHAEGEGTAKAIAKKGVPSLTIELPEINEQNLAYLLYAFEVMTAIAGQIYGIDPFNQPGVELSKKYTYALLGKPGFEQYLAEVR